MAATTEVGALAAMLLCKRTGEPAGTEDACGTCDACRWFELAEAAFREEEAAPDE